MTLLKAFPFTVLSTSFCKKPLMCKYCNFHSHLFEIFDCIYEQVTEDLILLNGLVILV